MSESLRDRAGLVVAGPDSRSVVEAIVAAEEAGVAQVWMTQGAAARLHELLDQGLDELLVMPVPILDEVAERQRAARLVGGL